MTDYLYAGPIDTEFSARVIVSNRIAYFCSECGHSIDVPSETDRCSQCMHAAKEAA
jgi:hypothetical protein